MRIDDIDIEVEFKHIKNTHLAVYPPDGRVHVSAPDYLTEDDVRSYVVSKWDWILKQRREIVATARQTPREYVSGESYYHFGQRFRLRVVEQPRCAHSITKQGNLLIMTVQPGTTTENRALVMREWQRAELKTLLTDMVASWAAKVNEENVTWEVKQMSTQWGSCIEKKRHLIFNLELARVPKGCIEYVVVHELTHLKVKNHNKLFSAFMTQRLPRWQERRTELNNFIAQAYPQDEA